jgi:UDP-N-acetylmuramate: L-alanyl-gamma-D-glutamyl-meso-diaminopimelate ligase
MAIAAAHHTGVPLDNIAAAVASFKGVQRRQILRGERDGVKVIEDFGKHPTNIRETLRALRQRFPAARVWAAVDPRANTMCRVEIQIPLTAALREAHGAFIAPVDRPERFGPGQALDTTRLAAELTADGHEVFAEPDVDSIVARAKTLTRPGDVIVAFSSGGFGGIYEKLLA